MHETFWTLLRDKAHWEFEIFLMVVFDVLLAGVWQFFVRLRKQQVTPPEFETPKGICQRCGGLIIHLIESGIHWCLGCGDITAAKEFVEPETKIQTKESK